jgi:hypothetical protein
VPTSKSIVPRSAQCLSRPTIWTSDPRHLRRGTQAVAPHTAWPRWRYQSQSGRSAAEHAWGGTHLGGDREFSRRDDGTVPKWVVRGLQTVFVVASGVAFFLAGMTTVFLATGFVNVTPDCVAGHLAHPSPFNLFGNGCVKPPGYMPWMVVFGVVGAAVGLLFSLGVLQLFSRIRSRRWHQTRGLSIT